MSWEKGTGVHIEAMWTGVHGRRLTLSPDQASHSTNPGAFLSSTFGVTMRREACSDANAQLADEKVGRSRNAKPKGKSLWTFDPSPR